jgi:hypothetical protein
MLSIENGKEAPKASLLEELTRALPPIVVDIQAEENDVEATVSLTILDRVPDIRGVAAAVRRLLRTRR